MPEQVITGYHAHVYFDADTVETARALCEAARDRFGVVMGRVHEKPVGPHPMCPFNWWNSCLWISRVICSHFRNLKSRSDHCQYIGRILNQ